MFQIVCVVGARPNSVKIAPLIDHIQKEWGAHFQTTLVHTGQHDDEKLSQIFFDELHLPRPDVNLCVGAGSQIRQIAQIMERFEAFLLLKKTDLVLVVGDISSTLAAALTAEKMGIKVAHVEAGLRSFDRKMPEETNRVLTDRLSDFLFVTEERAVQNLINEGCEREKIFLVGNVMIDALVSHVREANRSTILDQLQLTPKKYALMTLHRPVNVDRKEELEKILYALSQIQKRIRVVFPIHPRTENRLEAFGLKPLLRNLENVTICDPVGYLDFLRLMRDSKMVLTDSGGIEEETTVLGIPCLTLRENTERPVTVTEGSNLLIGTDPQKAIKAVTDILEGRGKRGRIPLFWDGRAAHRIIQVLHDKYRSREDDQRSPIQTASSSYL